VPASPPQVPPKPSARGAQPWAVSAGEVSLRHASVQVHDQASGLAVDAQDLALTLRDAGSDLARPVQFDGALVLRAGGRIAARGRIVPATGEVQADVQAQDIALAPVQPLLAHYVRLRLAGGSVSVNGRVTGRASSVSTGRDTVPAWQYEGAAHVRGLVLNEANGDRFASWKDVGAERLRATVSPNRLEIPELRVEGAQAKLMIENDRSLNAARLLVQQSATAVPVGVRMSRAQPAASEPFPVRIRRVRLHDAKLDFTDLSLRPQFAAKIYELQGTINGVSTDRNTRSQVELEGRVDEFGLARVRGEINAFSPRDSTDLQLVFRNVDMVPASPYSMKFAGYRIEEGRISLDLQYKVKDGQLQGDNRVVIDRLKLGERVDSPDALKLPLQLAIALLKDSDGRIELGLPVSGSLDDPQFSYAAVIWKAIVNVLAKAVTAPFRALGAALGMRGERLEAVDFDAGSARLLPPEREKLRQVAHMLAQRAQLKLSVPGPFDEAADGAALRRRALRAEVARRAGMPLPAGEEPGPLDTGDRPVRVALRELFAQRFGKPELEKEVANAEKSAAVPAVDASAPVKSLAPWQRLGKWVQGEPQVADASRFYATLQRRLEDAQELAAGALQKLGEERAASVVQALAGEGVPRESASVGPAAAVQGSGGVVEMKLELSAR
jgi:hypothetical protein